jgi:hypothetical protein
MTSIPPDQWQLPVWHSELANIPVEFEQLQRLATALLAIDPTAFVHLEILEYGYLYVQVDSPSGQSTVVWSVDPFHKGESRRLGVFTNVDTQEETEDYFESCDEAAEFIASWIRG